MEYTGGAVSLRNLLANRFFFLYVTKIEFLSSTSSGTSIGLEALLIL